MAATTPRPASLDERRIPNRWATWIAIGLVPVWLTFALLPAVSPALREAVLAVGRLPVLVLAVWAAVSTWRAAVHPRERAAWRAFAAAFAALTVGDLLFGWVRVLLGATPLFAPSDPFYLAYFPLMLAGLLALPRALEGPRERLQLALDAGIVALGGGLVLWHLMVAPQLVADATPDTARHLVNLAFPLGDLLTLLGLATVLLRLPRGPARRVVLLLGGVLLTSLSGDLLWAVADLDGTLPWRVVAHVLWMLQPVLLVAAAEQARRETARRAEAAVPAPTAPSLGALPYVALAAGYGTLAWVAWTGSPGALRPLLVGAFALTVLVVLRQAVAQRESAALLAERERRRGEARFAALIERASEALLVLGADLSVRYASPAAQPLVPDGTLARLAPEDRATLAEYAAASSRGQLRETTLELRFGSESQGWTVTEARLDNLLAEPLVEGLVLHVRDVSERRRLEAQLRFQALHDPLTQLPNRELFLDRVERAFARGEAAGRVPALAILDLDRFKLVNDAHGPRLGDQALAASATRLAAVLGRGDSVARLGGDEFGVLVEEAASLEEALARIERVRAAVAHPLRIGAVGVALTASAGVALARDAEGAAAWLRNADIALHQAKGEGGDRAELFRAERHGRALLRIKLETELPALLESGAFVLRFQPVFRVGEIVPAGLYARLAWRDPAQAPASIPAVLGAAREGGHAPALGRWLRAAFLREVAALLRFLPDAASLRVGFHLDPLELREADLADELATLIARLELRPRQLLVELPERALAELRDLAPGALGALRARGVGLALADFGAAHAHFDLLDAVEFDALVLAEALVARSERGERPGTLLRAAIATGRALGLEVVAPGVTSVAQRERLAALGCEMVTGPLYGEPLPYERLLPWLGARFTEARENARG